MLLLARFFTGRLSPEGGERSMRNYEVMYIVRPNIEDEERKNLVERVNKILTDNGAEITESKDWGKRRLAYEINNYRDGYYQIVNFKAEPDTIREFERLIRINEDIIRYLIVKEEN